MNHVPSVLLGLSAQMMPASDADTTVTAEQKLEAFRVVSRESKRQLDELLLDGQTATAV